MRLSKLQWIVCLASLLAAETCRASDWPRFRGPNGAAVSDEHDTPAHWSPKENIVWRTQLPGPGTSSPITTGGKVFLTCYTGYGVGATGQGTPDKLERILVCLDEQKGKILWQKAVKATAG